MSNQALWIGANIVNILALAVIIRIFERRRGRARLPLPSDVDIASSVIAQRNLNAISAGIDSVFYLLLLLLGVGMLGGGMFWQNFVDGPVPAIIPAGTIMFAAIYLGKAATRIWESKRREEIAELAAREALERSLGC